MPIGHGSDGRTSRLLRQYPGIQDEPPELEQRFGHPSAPRGTSSLPQVRLLAQMETGTHAIFAAAIGHYETSHWV